MDDLLAKPDYPYLNLKRSLFFSQSECEYLIWKVFIGVCEIFWNKCFTRMCFVGNMPYFEHMNI